MNHEELMISLYLRIEEAYQKVTQEHRIRQSGESPQLTDIELLTLEIFCEIQGVHTDAAIWRYADQHWRQWFPQLPSHASFAKQSANLCAIKMRIFEHCFKPTDTVHIIDGVPIAVCHLARSTRCKVFKGEAARSFCAAKNEHYYGFKGHVLIDINQQVVGFTLTPANIDERDVLDNWRGHLQGLLLGDKGYIRSELQQHLRNDNIALETPLRGNMKDSRPTSWLRTLLTVRRRVETAIGQLVETFRITQCKVKDSWHLTNRLVRKILAYNFALSFKCIPNNPSST